MDIVMESADVVLIITQMSSLVTTRDLAQRSYQLTFTNVMIALSFNGIGVLTAVSGIITPTWAMLAMELSVVMVLMNSFFRTDFKQSAAMSSLLNEYYRSN